jgi:hypothetical protein
MLFKTLTFIEKIFATTSSFLADIQTGFFTQSSKSTTKYSGKTFKISLFGFSIPFLAISRALSTSSCVISFQATAITHLLLITSNDEELNDK